jgi:hypothetical protein
MGVSKKMAKNARIAGNGSFSSKFDVHFPDGQSHGGLGENPLYEKISEY